jgi:hypothetical protein
MMLSSIKLQIKLMLARVMKMHSLKQLLNSITHHWYEALPFWASGEGIKMCASADFQGPGSALQNDSTREMTDTTQDSWRFSRELPCSPCKMFPMAAPG